MTSEGAGWSGLERVGEGWRGLEWGGVGWSGLERNGRGSVRVYAAICLLFQVITTPLV